MPTTEAGPPIFADPVRMAMAAALWSAHIDCDFGEDVDRLVDTLEGMGLTITPRGSTARAEGYAAGLAAAREAVAGLPLTNPKSGSHEDAAWDSALLRAVAEIDALTPKDPA